MLGFNFGLTLDEAGVPRDKHNECLSWAFGDNYKDIELDAMPDTWNSRHAGMFKLDCSDNVLWSTYQIAKVFMMSEGLKKST